MADTLEKALDKFQRLFDEAKTNPFFPTSLNNIHHKIHSIPFKDMVPLENTDIDMPLW